MIGGKKMAAKKGDNDTSLDRVQVRLRRALELLEELPEDEEATVGAVRGLVRGVARDLEEQDQMARKDVLRVCGLLYALRDALQGDDREEAELLLALVEKAGCLADRCAKHLGGTPICGSWESWAGESLEEKV
jgi:hypothetical protein